MITADGSSQVQIKNFLKDSLLEIMSILKAECGSLFLFDGKNNELVLESFQNPRKISIAGVKYRMGEGVSGKVIESHAPVLVTDINTDRRFHKNGFAHYHTNSFISVPLVTPDGLIGLINIADKSTQEPFTEKDLEFASTLAEYACIIAYNLDLSEKLRAEKEEIDRQKALLEKYATVGKLAAGVVHEVNNPLDGIIRFTNMLLGQSDSHSVAHEYLLEIKRGFSRIENITKSLLQFSHQVNATAAKQSYVELNQIIEDSLSVFGALMSGNIRIERRLSAPAIKLMDLGLSHIFVNLIKNAVDAMPQGGSLRIETNVRDEKLTMIVSDSGNGMDESVIEHIFEPFYTTKAQDKGTGLGLAICKEIVNRYDGAIAVD
ncbi:MAG TPA: ATP-binding protein, partial [Candidatus Omnitrophota bacterium]|nr:ATP-binding protein [Candidatus Omnitrophota bacterium]